VRRILTGPKWGSGALASQNEPSPVFQQDSAVPAAPWDEDPGLILLVCSALLFLCTVVLSPSSRERRRSTRVRAHHDRAST